MGPKVRLSSWSRSRRRMLHTSLLNGSVEGPYGLHYCKSENKFWRECLHHKCRLILESQKQEGYQLVSRANTWIFCKLHSEDWGSCRESCKKPAICDYTRTVNTRIFVSVYSSMVNDCICGHLATWHIELNVCPQTRPL
ncbi:hypothetical protein GDO78_001644 [Eleutherodactylus coqui]|uniref:Uncharacterized protein n=1 Tax=Eleutherodactylus coqui TaxID=57060 RepID=A0A8J6FU01_ELECQ|nr:hypothetical protein GDO78_001644 [Eleutherodactylus coqui]